MSVNLELGELYGMNSIDEVMQTINDLKEMGMTDEEINEVLERSKNNHKS